MKRDPAETYWKLIDKFAQCPTGEVRHFVYADGTEYNAIDSVFVSYAHRTCLCYLIWIVEQDLEACEEYIRSAGEWRKKANRYATARTLIERLARISIRRHLPKLKKQRAQSMGGIRTAQNQIKNGVGVFSPDYPTERRRETGRMGAAVTHSKPMNLWCKKWWICDPKGNWFVVENMSAFCREHGLNDRYMKDQATRERELLRGGWNCRKFRETELNEDGLPPFAL